MRRKFALLRLRKSQGEAEPVTEVNIIPVIDISLVLLVILFVTAPMLSYPNHPVELPRASSPESGERTLAVTATRDGRIAVASRDVGWASLGGALKAELERRPGSVVLLRVDRTIRYATVNRLLIEVKRAGAKQVALATEGYK